MPMPAKTGVFVARATPEGAHAQDCNPVLACDLEFRPATALPLCGICHEIITAPSAARQTLVNMTAVTMANDPDRPVVMKEYGGGEAGE